jgi:hypothetical protein
LNLWTALSNIDLLDIIILQSRNIGCIHYL